MLGVTPELAPLGERMTAVDVNPGMIEHIWPGDRDDRRAIQGNWLELPVDDESADAVIGDGSLTCVSFPEDYVGVFEEIRRVLRPGGRAVVRLYCRPDHCESLAEVGKAGLNRGAGSVHALKIRTAIAWGKENEEPNVPIATIRDEFMKLFPDRTALATVNGWDLEDIGTIDAYKGSNAIYSFATAGEVAELARRKFGSVRLSPSGDYEMADQCPLLILDKD